MISFGVSLFPTEYTLPATDFARAVEERGLDAIFFPEHTHIPTSRKTPWPGGAELPRHYSHTHDPFVALAACAAVTSRIQLGFGVCLVTQRDPLVTAKQVASLDLISGGRVIFGVGAGWNREEMENHGTPFHARWPILRERVLAMKTLWRDEEASFHGTHVNFDPVWSWPKPAQPGGPPIWLGAKSRFIVDRVAEYGDGFMPIFGREGQASVAALREACDRRGRDFSQIALASFGPPPTEAASVQCINEGYTHLIYVLPCAEPAKVLHKLDQLAEVVARLRA